MPEPPAAPASTQRSLFETSLPLIDRIIASAGRRLGLAGEEAADFRSTVHLRLIEDDYAVLRKFGGRSSLPTYLTAVIQNLARDHRIRQWGRWRPSAAAERLGVPAIQLEILLERDGFSADEAAESLRANHNVRLTRIEIAELAAQLPGRVKPRFVGPEALGSVAGRDRAEERIEEGERMKKLSQTRRVLGRALAELEVTDRLVLKMHYQSGLQIAAVARALDLDQRQLYTRRDRALRSLRRAFEAAGLAAADVLTALGRRRSGIEIDFAAGAGEESQTDPSKGVDLETEDER